MENSSRIEMDSGWHSKLGSVVIGALILVRSQFDEGGGGLTSQFPWLLLDWFSMRSHIHAWNMAQG